MGQCGEELDGATHFHPSLPPSAHLTCEIQLSSHDYDVVFFGFPLYFQPCSSQSGSCHGFYCAHDPAHLTHTENRGGPYPVHYGDVGLLLEGAWPSLPAWLEHSSGHNHSQKGLAQPDLLLPKTWAGN